MSTRRPNKRSTPGNQSETLWLTVWAAVAVLVLLAAPAWAGWWAAGKAWSATAIVVAAGLYVVAFLLAALSVKVWLRWRKNRQWTDPMAKSMSHRSDFKELTAPHAAADAARLGDQGGTPGVPLGRAANGGQRLYALYEWSQVWIMGTRAGKSRSVAIPQIMTHGGAVVSTSNKSDVYDSTFGPRSELGTCWVNDPQRIAQRPAEWYWQPLSFVTTVERADRLVAVFSASRTAGDTKGLDPYFEPEGRKLAGDVLVAARLAGYQITQITDWLTGEKPPAGVLDPVAVLRAGGLDALAADIEGFLSLDQGQRDGVYGTARSFFGFLRDPRFVQWVAPSGPEDDRPVFDPNEFVRTRDTLYLLSKEGEGSGRAITGALTMATYTAAEDYATECGRRVPNSILFSLDEAANVCRWPELPNLYSHAGSRGIILVTILQSRSQGTKVWGDDFAMMWSAANVAAVGRGINDEGHLRDLATLIGTRQIRQTSISTGTKGHRSRNVQIGEEQIFTEAELRALPTGRAVLLVTGTRAVLLKLLDYSTYDWSAAVEASVEVYGPGGIERGPVRDPFTLEALNAAQLAAGSTRPEQADGADEDQSEGRELRPWQRHQRVN